MQFSIIGTGNMAWFLANKLTIAGHQCNYVYGRNPEQATLLANKINSKPTDRIRDIKDENDAVIIAVTDSSIAEIAPRIIADEAVIIHTSGFAGTDILREARHYGVLWPIYSIVKNNLPAHRNIPCAVEANDTHSKLIIRNLAHALSDVVFEANHQQRQWLHLAAVIGNNFTNHLMAIDEMICKEQGIDFAHLRPILQQTFDRVQGISPIELQTGPAARNDRQTMDAQVQLLAKHPEWKEIYTAVSDSIRRSSLLSAEKPVNN